MVILLDDGGRAVYSKQESNRVSGKALFMGAESRSIVTRDLAVEKFMAVALWDREVFPLICRRAIEDNKWVGRGTSN